MRKIQIDCQTSGIWNYNSNINQNRAQGDKFHFVRIWKCPPLPDFNPLSLSSPPPLPPSFPPFPETLYLFCNIIKFVSNLSRLNLFGRFSCFDQFYSFSHPFVIKRVVAEGPPNDGSRTSTFFQKVFN